MNKLKAKAAAFGTLGLTGFLLALAAGVLATSTEPFADRDLLTTFYLAGMFGGALFISLGGMLYERALQREEQERRKEVSA